MFDVKPLGSSGHDAHLANFLKSDVPHNSTPAILAVDHTDSHVQHNSPRLDPVRSYQLRIPNCHYQKIGPPARAMQSFGQLSQRSSSTLLTSTILSLKCEKASAMGCASRRDECPLFLLPILKTSGPKQQRFTAERACLVIEGRSKDAESRAACVLP